VSRFRAGKVIGYGVVGLVALLTLAVLGASVVLQGPRLAGLIGGALPKNRGKLEIAGVTWSLRALVDIVTDAPSPISVDGLRIVDPEGTVVLDVPHLDAAVKLRTLIGGSFSIHDLKVSKASWRFAQMKTTPEIGFLAALAPAQAPNTPPPPPKDAQPKGPGSFFEIADAELDDLNALFDFPGAWGLELRHAHAKASLIQSAVDPAHPIFGFDAGPVTAEGGGWLRIMDDNLLPFDKVSITRVATTQEHPDDIFLDLREAKTGRSVLSGKGFFTGIYGVNGPASIPGINLHASFQHAADAFNQVIAGKKIDGLTLSGDDASAVMDLHDTFAALKVSARFSGLDVAYPPYRALGLGFQLGFDGGAMAVTVKDFGLQAPGGGRLALGATLDAAKLKLRADLSLQHFTTDSFVPTALQPMAGGQLDGGLHADATLGPGAPSGAIRDLDLTLTRRRAAGLPRTLRVHGAASASPTRFNTSGITVEVPGAKATATGDVNLARQTVTLGLEVLAYDLARLLSSLNLPPIGQSGRVSAQVSGPLLSPAATGDAVVNGLSFGGRKVPAITTRFGLQQGVARLDSLSGDLLGGHVDARGTVRLFERSAKRMLPNPIVDADLDIRNIDLGAAAGTPLLSGRLSMQAHAQGPTNALTASVRLPGNQHVTVAGEELTVGPVDVELDRRLATIKQLHLARRKGGTVDITGTASLDQALALDVVIDHLPLDGLPGLADAEMDLGGNAAAKLHLGGTVAHPTVGGQLVLSGVHARGIELGDARIDLTPDTTTGSPAVVVGGDLFQRLRLDARAALTASGPEIHAALAFNKLIIESLLPELVNLGDGHGLASGRVQVDIVPGKPLAADVALDELSASIARSVEAAPGEPTSRRVEVSASRPIHVTVAGDKIVLDQLDLATTGGELHARGALDGKKVNGNVDGHLDLELLQPFLSGTVDRLTGAMDVSVVASGTLDQPGLRGRLAVSQPVRIRPKTFDADVVLGTGIISLDPEGAEVSKLAVTIDGATTQLDGHVTLGKDFKPQAVDAKLAGEISARFLGSLAGDAISDAQGRARIKAEVRGPLGNPTLTAWLGLGTITFRLRDPGTEVEVKSGVVEVTNSGVSLRNVRVVLDDQGTLVIGAAGVRPGRVQIKKLVPLELGQIDFPLHGEQLTYRSPGVFEINDLAFDLDLGGNLNDGFQLGGELRVIAGRYVQDFKLSNLVLSPRTNESSVQPFYEGKPLLENLGLDLNVRTLGDAFVVQNNIAPEIHIDIALHVGGTLSRPVLAGEVRPTDGHFQIPVLRGEFDLVPNVNHITFVETKSLPDGETPEINVEAQNPVVDSAGAEHNVRMNIHGPLREMQIDLSTDDGLDRNQTALLLLTGRTTTNSDRVATQNPTVGANIGTGLDIAGQATRDTIANLMEPIIGNTFERAIGLQLRLTVGPDGFETRLRKRISRYTNFQVDALWGFQGQNRQTLQFEQWLRDYFTGTVGMQRLVLSQQQGPTETLPINFNMELRLDYAIRL